jgi:Family of unknown function (DUF6326)
MGGAEALGFLGCHSEIGVDMDTETINPGATDSLIKTTAMTGRGARLSLLWVFATLNYLYCDLMGLMDPDSLKQYLTGTVNGLQITQGFLLSAAILMEIPIAMVLASSVMPHRASRWANIVAGTVMTLVQIGSLFMAPPTVFYAFYSTVEIACTAFIVWYAWRWQVAPPGTRDRMQ